VFEEAEELAGDLALEAPLDLTVGLAFGAANPSFPSSGRNGGGDFDEWDDAAANPLLAQAPVRATGVGHPARTSRSVIRR
jgi:hypothetical protein